MSISPLKLMNLTSSCATLSRGGSFMGSDQTLWIRSVPFRKKRGGSHTHFPFYPFALWGPNTGHHIGGRENNSSLKLNLLELWSWTVQPLDLHEMNCLMYKTNYLVLRFWFFFLLSALADHDNYIFKTKKLGESHCLYTFSQILKISRYTKTYRFLDYLAFE